MSENSSFARELYTKTYLACEKFYQVYSCHGRRLSFVMCLSAVSFLSFITLYYGRYSSVIITLIISRIARGV